jgi:hypothetical protein
MRIRPPTPYASHRPSIDGFQLSATFRACTFMTEATVV